MENESKNFKMELFRMSWFMRGGISANEIFELPFEDRQILGDLIKQNLDTAKKTGQPFF